MDMKLIFSHPINIEAKEPNLGDIEFNTQKGDGDGAGVGWVNGWVGAGVVFALLHMRIDFF